MFRLGWCIAIGGTSQMKIVLQDWVICFRRCHMFFQWRETISIILILWWSLFMQRQRKILIHALTSSTTLRLLNKSSSTTIKTRTKSTSPTKPVTANWNSFTRTSLSSSAKLWATNTWKTIFTKLMRISRAKAQCFWIRSIPKASSKGHRMRIGIKGLDQTWMRMAKLLVQAVCQCHQLFSHQVFREAVPR